MSAESELRAVLTGHAPLIAQVPATRISIDAVLPTVARPFIAFSKQQRSDELGLDGGLLAVQSTIDIQCVGSSRSAPDPKAAHYRRMRGLLRSGAK